MKIFPIRLENGQWRHNKIPPLTVKYYKVLNEFILLSLGCYSKDTKFKLIDPNTFRRNTRNTRSRKNGRSGEGGISFKFLYKILT